VNAVLGVADHNGWAECVTVAASRGVPVVVDRRRLELVEPGIPSMPYHHETLKMPRPEGERLVARVRDSVLRTTFEQVTGLRDELHPLYTIVAMTLRVPPLDFVPVTVAEAHQSYNVTCRADGMMYHDALSIAARRLKLPVKHHPRGEEVARAAARLDVSVEDVERFLERAGEPVGKPWQKEHRLAVAAAVAVLAERQKISLPSV